MSCPYFPFELTFALIGNAPETDKGSHDTGMASFANKTGTKIEPGTLKSRPFRVDLNGIGKPSNDCLAGVPAGMMVRISSRVLGNTARRILYTGGVGRVNAMCTGRYRTEF